MHNLTDRITHTTAFATPVVEYWLERETAQWVHHEGTIRRPITPWVNALTMELHLAPLQNSSFALTTTIDIYDLPSFSLSSACFSRWSVTLSGMLHNITSISWNDTRPPGTGRLRKNSSHFLLEKYLPCTACAIHLQSNTWS